MISFYSLEYHAAHACNLACSQCSHYSNLSRDRHPTLEEAKAEFSLWKGRLNPSLIAILGGEPTLNKDLAGIIQEMRSAFPQSDGLLVTNGLTLDRFPHLPELLIDNGFKLDVSRHGSGAAYTKRFEPVLEMLNEWRESYPDLKITVRESIDTWMRQYQVIDGRPFPWEADGASAYRICMQKFCTQLYQGKLWKCPALAYFHQMEDRMSAHDIKEWQPFRDYKAITADATDEDIERFFREGEICQCSLCPGRVVKFEHPDPTDRKASKENL